MESQDGLVLVCGATGQQGGPVACQLLAAGRRTRVLTRHPEKAEPLGEAGAEVGTSEKWHWRISPNSWGREATR